MKKALGIISSLLLAIGIMFYVLITNSERNSHMHFSTRGGVLTNIVYYTNKPPESPSQHECEGNFADMGDDLFETHARLWREKYGIGNSPSR